MKWILSKNPLVCYKISTSWSKNYFPFLPRCVLTYLLGAKMPERLALGQEESHCVKGWLFIFFFLPYLIQLIYLKYDLVIVGFLLMLQCVTGLIFAVFWCQKRWDHKNYRLPLPLLALLSVSDACLFALCFMIVVVTLPTLNIHKHEVEIFRVVCGAFFLACGIGEIDRRHVKVCPYTPYIIFPNICVSSQ